MKLPGKPWEYASIPHELMKMIPAKLDEFEDGQVVALYITEAGNNIVAYCHKVPRTSPGKGDVACIVFMLNPGD